MLRNHAKRCSGSAYSARRPRYVSTKGLLLLLRETTKHTTHHPSCFFTKAGRPISLTADRSNLKAHETFTREHHTTTRTHTPSMNQCRRPRFARRKSGPHEGLPLAPANLGDPTSHNKNDRYHNTRIPRTAPTDHMATALLYTHPGPPSEPLDPMALSRCCGRPRVCLSRTEEEGSKREKWKEAPSLCYDIYLGGKFFHAWGSGPCLRCRRCDSARSAVPDGGSTVAVPSLIDLGEPVCSRMRRPSARCGQRQTAQEEPLTRDTHRRKEKKSQEGKYRRGSWFCSSSCRAAKCLCRRIADSPIYSTDILAGYHLSLEGCSFLI